MKVSLLSLGCPRNLLDSEIILGSLKKEGFAISDVDEGADIFIINTCGFIESARDESINTILEALELKKEGKIKYLIICGCLPQMFGKKLAKELREVDLIVGTSDFPKIPRLIKGLKKIPGRASISRDLDYLYDEKSPRFVLTPKHYAYVKISEGCSNFCSYCIISRLRGKFRSRKIESVVEEIKKLSGSGNVKEINLIGQDTTLFGIDRYGKTVFPELLKRICALKDCPRWIRILYTHPAHYSDCLIRTIRDERRICKYLDLPIQHINDNILKRMNRHTTKDGIIKLIDKLRKNIPEIVLRTSIIVGFPGERDRDFKELLDFMRDMKFERLGAFIYSDESDTKAYRFKDRIPRKVKEDRFDELMKLQSNISAEINGAFMGKDVEVLIDEKMEGENNRFLGRTKGDAPEVDGIVYVNGKNLKVGKFYNVKIKDTLEYDLVGEAR